MFLFPRVGKVSHPVNPGDRDNRSMVLGSPGRSLLSAPDDTSIKGPDAEEMGVSKNSGVSPQIIHFNWVFHHKPSILRYPCFWKHPNGVRSFLWELSRGSLNSPKGPIPLWLLQFWYIMISLKGGDGRNKNLGHMDHMLSKKSNSNISLAKTALVNNWFPLRMGFLAGALTI